MPAPTYGFKRSGLFQDTYVEAFEVTKQKENFRDTHLTEERMERINDIRGVHLPRNFRHGGSQNGPIAPYGGWSHQGDE
jgi:hypothetical protein